MGRGLSQHSKFHRSQSRKRKRSVSVGGEAVVEEVEEDPRWPEEDPEQTIDSKVVYEKYKHAASIANLTLQGVLDRLKPGASVLALCQESDAELERQALLAWAQSESTEGEQIERGIAFPTCISLNERACHFAPADEGEDVLVQAGDVAHVELGVHIDGYIATAAHTVVVAPGECPEERRMEVAAKFDTISAAWYAAEAALRTLTPQRTNDEVTDVIGRIATAYNVKPVQGCLSHRMARYEEAGQQVIINHKCIEAVGDQNHDEVTFNDTQVWSLDVCVTNNVKDNRLKDHGDHINIYKRSEVVRGQKLKAAQYVLRELRSRGRPGMLPFHLRSMSEGVVAKSGCSILRKEGLMDGCPVLCGRRGDVIARFKFTVLLTPAGIEKIAGLGRPAGCEDFSPIQLGPELTEFLQKPLKFDSAQRTKRKARGRKKQKLNAAGDAPPPGAVAPAAPRRKSGGAAAAMEE